MMAILVGFLCCAAPPLWQLTFSVFLLATIEPKGSTGGDGMWFGSASNGSIGGDEMRVGSARRVEPKGSIGGDVFRVEGVNRRGRFRSRRGQ
jgi:hypothetical protein